MTRRWKSAALSSAAAMLLAAAQSLGEGGEHRFSNGIETAKHATVGILDESRQGGQQPASARFALRASGFFIGDGYLVTAHHAVERDEPGKKGVPEMITVLTTDLDEFSAALVGVNPFLDLVVYRVTTDGATLPVPARFAEHEPEPGDEVFTVGYPLGWGPAVGFGRIGNLNTFLPTVESRLFQIDLSACSGNSGGGVFNAEGEIVGVMHAMIQTDTVKGEPRCSRFAFGVSGRLVQRIVTALIQGEQPGFSRLGIQLTVVKVGTRWRVAVSDASGPALAGGVRKGDILLTIDDRPIRDAVQLKNYLIERTVPGQRVAVRVRRGEQEEVLFVTLGKA